MSKEKELVRLSASKIQCLESCSMTFYLKYQCQIPDSSNRGSERGSTVHEIFEVLSNPRHFNKYINKIVAADSLLVIPSIKRLIVKLAKKHNNLDLAAMVEPISKKDKPITTLKCIDQMALIGIRTDFIDLNGKELIKSELAFDITSAAPAYRIVGFVDRIFKEGDIISFSDFKSSKKKFSKKELHENIQALCYLCAARKLYPEFKKRKARFIILRFPDDPIQEVNEVGDDVLDGFEYFLEAISEYMKDFDMKKARLKTQAPLTRQRGGGLCFSNRTGHRCAYLDPFTYYHLIDKDGNVVKTAKEGQPREKKEGCYWTKKEFSGCPMWQEKPSLDFL